MSILSQLFKDVFSDKEISDERMLPPIFCLTLSEEPWKRREAAKHFAERGLHPVFVDGLQGISLGLRATNPYDYDLHGQGLFVHASQIGCTLSHRVALSVALASLAPEFIVCEDDVSFHPSFTQVFLDWREALPEEVNIAQLDYSGWEDKRWEPINDSSRRIFYPFCASCIWWKREAAQQALKLLRPIDRPYDVILIERVFPFLNHAVAFPRLAGQRSRDEKWPSAVGDQPKNQTNKENEQ